MANRGTSAGALTALGPSWYLLALALSVTLTVALGLPPFLLADSVWWIVLASAPSLFTAGFLLGWRGREPEPLYGAVLATLYFGIVAGVLFSAELAEALPDPLPGLATGDSTFFFAWPLVILLTGFLGSLSGGRIAARRRR